MKNYADAILFATPNGHYDQGEEYGNPHERHLSDWYFADFLEMGMTVCALGDEDAKNGNLVGWWQR